ncbi:MAG: helix-turn-helix domain-containing protein [Bradyrhizobium sp.]
MPSRSALLGNFPVLRTSDPELAIDRLTAYGLSSFDMTPSKSEFEFRTNHLHMTNLALSYCAYGCGAALGFREASFVRQIFNIDGVSRYAAGSQSGEIAPGGWTPAISTRTPLKLQFTPGYRQLVLRIEFDALLRHLSALIGQEVSETLAFDEGEARGPAMSSLRRAIFQFASDFNEHGKFFSELAAAEVERMVIMKFLMCHRHNYTHLLWREPLPATSSAVKTVEEFIEANWDKPIDIPAMAKVAKVSARSLFRQFKQDRGYSPADFAKQVRLNRARELLEQCAEGASVTQIAFRCGFQNPGHFARDFRLAFGELPSETLKKSTQRFGAFPPANSDCVQISPRRFRRGTTFEQENQ